MPGPGPRGEAPRGPSLGPGAIPAWIDGALRPVGEAEIHRRGLRHPAVSTFVTRGQRLLIRRRPLSTYLAPGLWTATCHAHPAWGEAPEDAAARHLAAELGLSRLALSHRGRVEYRADLAGGLHDHEVVEIFRAELDPHRRATPGGAAGRAPAEGPWRGRAEARAASGRAEPADAIWVGLEDLADEMLRRAERFAPWLRLAFAEHMALIFDDPSKAAP